MYAVMSEFNLFPLVLTGIWRDLSLSDYITRRSYVLILSRMIGPYGQRWQYITWYLYLRRDLTDSVQLPPL